jgi:hypothetical protein
MAGNVNSTGMVYFTVDATAPILTVNSPENKTYGILVEFNVSTNEGANWCGYSMDGTANVSMTSTSITSWNYTQFSVSNGAHSVIYYCQDFAGNFNSSNIVYFSYDSVPPMITIVNPLNTTYNTSVISFNVSTSEAANWCKYNMDGTALYSMFNTTPGKTEWGVIKPSIADGTHNVTYQCGDLYGNNNFSTYEYFTVDTTAPTITINYPENATYGASVIFDVSTSEAASWCTYSLDGAANVTMGNVSSTSWSLTNSSMTAGLHNVVYYCADVFGNAGNNAVRYFTVDLTAPLITIVSPENVTYNSSTVIFNATTDTGAGWCKFSVDSLANTTMTNDSTTIWSFTKPDMSNGSHNVVFYCSDVYGNVNSTEAFYFSVNLPVTPTTPSKSSPGGGGGGRLPMNTTNTTKNVTKETPNMSVEVKEEPVAAATESDEPAAESQITGMMIKPVANGSGKLSWLWIGGLAAASVVITSFLAARFFTKKNEAEKLMDEVGKVSRQLKKIRVR